MPPHPAYPLPPAVRASIAADERRAEVAEQQKKLQEHLDSAIAEFGKGRGRVMPTLGGKSLAEDMRVSFASLRKAIDDLKVDAAAAVMELTSEITNGKEGVKAIRAEAAAVKAAFADILGNGAPDDASGQ